MTHQILIDKAAEAEAAGFEQVAKDLDVQAERARKLAIAYEHYRYVPAEAIEAFKARLKAKTSRKPSAEEIKNARGYNSPRSYADNAAAATDIYDTLALTAIDKYPNLPPADALAKAKEARERGCFDSFVVAHVEPVATQIHLPDPIIFGLVNGCTDHFFVAEWGEDVKVSDLIAPHEG